MPFLSLTRCNFNHYLHLYSNYRYQTLDKHQFRLLSIHPGSQDDAIVCSLRVVDLLAYDDVEVTAPINGFERYEAISYVWGNAQDTVKIECDGRKVCVTRNLSDALRALRLTDSARVLWADAICINQKDPEERAAQVQMMGLIYWKAYCVRIWLGQDDGLEEFHRAKHAIRVIKDLAEIHLIALGETAEEYKAYLEIRFEEPDSITESEWVALHDLLTRPWFQRVWVIQEYGLARDAIFHCGKRSFTRKELREFISLLNNSRTHLKRSHNLPMRTISLGYDYWCSCRGGGRIELGSDPKEAETLLDILGNTRGLACTDRRDSVYAFLGHPSAFKQQLLDADPYHWYPRNYYYGRTTVISPNYHKSNTYLQVYHQLAVAAITNNDLGLNVLAHVAHYENTIETDIPSWVPRWDVFTSTYFRGAQIYFAASGSLPATKFELTSSHGKTLDLLSFQALRLDTIRCVRRLCVTEYLNECLDLMALLLSDAPEMRRSNAIPIPKLLTYPYEEPFVSAFASTMTAGLTSSWKAYCEPSDTNSEQHLRNFHAYYRRKHPEAFPSSLTEEETEHADYFAVDVDRVASDRVMFITHDGRLGLGPPIMESSDEIWIPMGAKMPIILRPYDDGRFRIVGQTYVYGVMRGESVEGKGHEQFEEVVVV